MDNVFLGYGIYFIGLHFQVYSKSAFAPKVNKKELLEVRSLRKNKMEHLCRSTSLASERYSF